MEGAGRQEQLPQDRGTIHIPSFLSVGKPSLSLLFLVFLPFLGPLPKHVEVPRLGVKSEL